MGEGSSQVARLTTERVEVTRSQSREYKAPAFGGRGSKSCDPRSADFQKLLSIRQERVQATIRVRRTLCASPVSRQEWVEAAVLEASVDQRNKIPREGERVLVETDGSLPSPRSPFWGRVQVGRPEAKDGLCSRLSRPSGWEVDLSD
jgi:hypothetical protein